MFSICRVMELKETNIPYGDSITVLGFHVQNFKLVDIYLPTSFYLLISLTIFYEAWKLGTNGNLHISSNEKPFKILGKQLTVKENIKMVKMVTYNLLNLKILTKEQI